MKSAFPYIQSIAYEGPKSKAPLAFKHYNANEIVAGKTMKDPLRFAVVSFDGSGTHTNIQSAIDAAPSNGTNWLFILVKLGAYQGQVIIPKAKPHVRITCEEMENVVSTRPYNVYDRKSDAAYQFDPATV